MGNVPDIICESLKDITEEGNAWRDDKIQIPEAYFDESFDEEQGTVPSLWVAPTLRSPSAASRKPCHPTAEDCERPDEETRDAALSRQASVEAEFDSPIAPHQVILQPGIDDEWTNPMRHGMRRDRLKYSWQPLGKCKALAGRILLTEARLLALRQHLPVITRLATSWRLVYTPRVHGVSLRTFYRQCQAWPGETLVLMEDAEGAVFGGFASHTWRASRNPHYGVPECFVFSCSQGESEGMEDCGLTIYPWTGHNQCFLHADLNGFSMGGGRSSATSSVASGFAFWLGEDFLHGTSEASSTFGNKGPLASAPEFILRTFECWSFDHGAAASTTASSKDNGNSQDEDIAHRAAMFTEAEQWNELGRAQ